MLFRLRADAQAATHQGRRKVLRGVRDPQKSGTPVAVHRRDVQVGRLLSELPGGPGELG